METVDVVCSAIAVSLLIGWCFQWFIHVLSIFYGYVIYVAF